MPSSRFKGRLLELLHGGEQASWGQDPYEFDPKAVERTVSSFDRFFAPNRPWEASVDGFETLPRAPVLLVSNHSGGTSIPDAWGLAWSWYRRFGTSRPLHFLAHEWVMPTRRLGEALGRRGVLWASREVALRALRCGRDVIVFPGGDLDTWRPWDRRYQVEFGGRTGYARLALEADVPMVPVANAGAHETLRVLTDGRGIAKALSFAKLARAHVFPIHLSLPWGLALGPWPHLPWPARLRYRLGRAIAPVNTPANDDSEPGQPRDAAVQALDRRVRAALQEELTCLARAG